MKKKTAALCITTCMITALLGGCGGTEKKTADNKDTEMTEMKEESDSTGTEKEGKGPGTLTVWNAVLNDIDDSGIYADDELAFNIALERYKEKYPDITVEIVRYGVDELNQLLTAASLSGDLPDVICTWAGSYTNNYKELLLNLEEHMTEEEISQYTGLDICREDMQPEGKLQALPEGLTTYNVYYNKSVLKEAGISEGTEPKTWDEFLELCKQVKDNTDAIPVSMVGDGSVEAWVLSEFFADELGPDELSKLGTGEIKFDSELFENLYNQFKRLFDEGYVNDDYKSTDYNAVSASFCNGDTAFNFGGSWGQSSLNDLMGDEVGTFKIPAYSKDSPFGDYIISQPGTSLSVINTTDMPEEAVDFIVTFTDGEYQQVECSQFGNIPSNKTADPSMITNPLTKISDEWVQNDKNLIGFDSLISAEAASEFYKNTVVVNSGDMTARELGKTIDGIMEKGTKSAE